MPSYWVDQSSWGLWSPLNGACGISQNQPFNPTSMPLWSMFMKCLLQTRNGCMMVTTLILLSPNAERKLQGGSLWLWPLSFARICVWVIWTQQPTCWSRRNCMPSRWTTRATNKSGTSWTRPIIWKCTGRWTFQQDLGHSSMYGENIDHEDFEGSDPSSSFNQRTLQKGLGCNGCWGGGPLHTTE